MVHFLKNHLYRRTACKIEKHYILDEHTTTTHTLVTCPQCILELIAVREREVIFLIKRFDQFKDATTPPPVESRNTGPKPDENQLTFKEE